VPDCCLVFRLFFHPLRNLPLRTDWRPSLLLTDRLAPLFGGKSPIHSFCVLLRICSYSQFLTLSVFPCFIPGVFLLLPKLFSFFENPDALVF